MDFVPIILCVLPERVSTFYGSDYYESNDTMTYVEAEEFCADLDGSVVSIGSAEENEMLGLLVAAYRDSW